MENRQPPFEKQPFVQHKVVFTETGKRNFGIFYPEPKVRNMMSGSAILRFLWRIWKFFLVPKTGQHTSWSSQKQENSAMLASTGINLLESGRKNQSESATTRVRVKKPNLPRLLLYRNSRKFSSTCSLSELLWLCPEKVMQIDLSQSRY